MSVLGPEKLAALAADLRQRFEKDQPDRVVVKPLAKLYGRSERSIGEALRHLGWTQGKTYVGSTCTRYWTPPATGTPVVKQSARLRDILKRGAHTFDGLAELLGTTKSSVVEMCDKLREEGYLVHEFGGHVEISKQPGPSESTEAHILKSDKNGYTKFGYVSDNHLASKYAREDCLSDLYDWFEGEGVKTVFNTGNWIDGEARFNKHDIFIHGMENQVNYFVEKYPQRRGVVTKFISGDDHEGWYCIKSGAEVLTQAGWALLDTLAEGVAIATMTEEGTFGWSVPNKIIHKEHKGEMVRFSHRSIDVTVTPDHRFEVLVKPSMPGEPVRQVMTAAQIAKDFKPRCYGIPRAARGWAGYDPKEVEVPRWEHVAHATDATVQHFRTLTSRDAAMLMAWYVTEGATSSGNVVQISQSAEVNQENCELIRGLLSRIGARFGTTHDRFRICSVELTHWLESECGKYSENVHLPRWVLDLPQDMLAEVLDVLIRGDGSHKDVGMKFYSKSPRLLGNVCEIAQKLGMGVSQYGSNGCEALSISERHQDAYLFEAPSIEQYDGLVHCVSVPSQRFLVRANGKSFWSMNCQREGIDIGDFTESKARAMGRKDLVHVGFMESFITLENMGNNTATQLLLVHPGGGSAYATSYAPQKYVEALSGGEKPAMILFGHWHKIFDLLIRNVICLGGGCTKDLDPFGRKMKLAYHLGGMIVECWQDEKGAIQRWRVEKKQFFDRGYYNDQWRYAGQPQRRAV